MSVPGLAEWWGEQIDGAAENEPIPVALDFIKTFDTSCCPAQVQCNDGQVYVIKGAHLGQKVIAEQVVGRLGAAIGMPVGRVRLVHLPQELIALTPDLAHFNPGLCHASEWIPGLSERSDVEYITTNRDRFAAISVLFGLTMGEDAQFFYETVPPYRVHSLDHGNCLAYDCDTPTNPLPYIVQECGLTLDEQISAVRTVSGLSDYIIARTVAALPADWGISRDYRIQLAICLETRRNNLIGAYTQEAAE